MIRTFLRSTRRGWMVFNEADKGGAAGAVVEAPPPTPHAGDQTSKEIFNQSRIDLGLDQPKPVAEPAPEPAPEPAKEETTPPAKKGGIPDDVIDPDKATPPKVHDDVAEILAAELPKGAKKEQIESFGKLKSKSAEKVQAALDRVAELEKKIGSGDSTKAELETLREQLATAQTRAAEIEEKWSKEAYASSPKFQAQFAGREQNAIELAKSYLDGTEIKQDIIDLAAHATGRKRIDLLTDAGLDDKTIQLISPHLAEFDRVQREKQGALANWQQLSKAEREQAQQQSEKARAQRAEQENKVWENVVSKIDLLPLRQSKDSPEWNTRAEQLREQAKKIFNGDGADLPTFAEIILKGKAYDAQQEVVEHLKGELTNARAEIAKLKSAAPGGSITGGTQDGAPPPPANPNDPKAREQEQKNTFNQELSKARGS